MVANARGTRNDVGLKDFVMIGVIADSADHVVVREFFELFKTPWEFCRAARTYDVVLCYGNGRFHGGVKLVAMYQGSETPFDHEQKVQAHCSPGNTHVLSYQGNRIPIYGNMITFLETGNGLLIDEGSREYAAYLDEREGRVLARIGYDLFSEIRTLLTTGQPVVNAGSPALELHIAF